MTNAAGLRWCALLLAIVLSAATLSPQQPPVARRLDACALVSRASLNHIHVPRDAQAVPDSGGVLCRWGNSETGYALVVKVYASMDLATIERMHIAAAKTSDAIYEPTVAEGAWSVGKSFGRVLVAGRNGKAFQLQYYVPPHSKGADRVDHRATNADREALLVVGKAVLSHL
jgi:hypothetical protein